MSDQTNSEDANDGGEQVPRTDGGQMDDTDIFGKMGESTPAAVSPADRLERLIDIYFVAPLRVAWMDWRTRIGGMIVIFYILMGTIGPNLVREPLAYSGEKWIQPFENMTFPLGTDFLGKGIFAQIVHATPTMLKMGAAGVMFSAGVAVLVGLVAGYMGGSIDRILMTFTDIVLTLPGLPLIFIIAIIIPPRDPFLVGALVSIDSWPGLARQLRSQVMTIREENYVEAARAMGRDRAAIIQKEIMPQMAPYIALNAAGSAAGVISGTVALYFLGVLPFTTDNWGVMLSFAHSQGSISSMGTKGHYILFPALALSGLTFGLILLSQGLDRVFNPRLRARHAKTVSDEDEGDGDDEDTVTRTGETSMGV